MNPLKYRFTMPHNLVSLAVFLLLANVLGALLLSFTAVQAQQEQARKITSDAFTRHRKNGVGDKGSQRQTLRTQAKAKTSKVYRLASATGPNPVLPGSSLEQLGITTWRLRPVTVNDTGATLAVVGENDSSSLWLPERVHADTKFREGDFVRLSIESPKTGYLYIFDRDVFADGTTGEALLIYPWSNMRYGENLVRAGKVIDIPGQEDIPSYFTARPKINQTGEMLTFMVTKSPLDLHYSGGKLKISNAQMAKWEKTWNSQSERFEMEGGQGQPWTREEQLAGLKLRPRQLTRDDPAPQTIYRVAAPNRFAFMVNLQLTYK